MVGEVRFELTRSRFQAEWATRLPYTPSMVRPRGIEPPSERWQRPILPLNYSRKLEPRGRVELPPPWFVAKAPDPPDGTKWPPQRESNSRQPASEADHRVRRWGEIGQESNPCLICMASRTDVSRGLRRARLVAREGVEPSFSPCESAVLPLDEQAVKQPVCCHYTTPDTLPFASMAGYLVAVARTSEELRLMGTGIEPVPPAFAGAPSRSRTPVRPSSGAGPAVGRTARAGEWGRSRTGLMGVADPGLRHEDCPLVLVLPLGLEPRLGGV